MGHMKMPPSIMYFMTPESMTTLPRVFGGRASLPTGRWVGIDRLLSLVPDPQPDAAQLALQLI